MREVDLPWIIDPCGINAVEVRAPGSVYQPVIKDVLELLAVDNCGNASGKLKNHEHLTFWVHLLSCSPAIMGRPIHGEQK